MMFGAGIDFSRLGICPWPTCLCSRPVQFHVLACNFNPWRDFNPVGNYARECLIRSVPLKEEPDGIGVAFESIGELLQLPKFALGPK